MRKKIVYMSFTVLFLFGTAIAARQQTDQQNRSDQQMQPMRRQDKQQQHRRQQEISGSQQQSRSKQDAELVGWVRIGYDYDFDNQIDAYEYIYAVDLQDARQKSRQRAGQQKMTTEQAGRQFEGQKRSRQMSGTIQETKEVTVAQDKKDHLLAKVQTRDNRPVVVNLGRVDQVEPLNLSDGDTIQFTARPASLNQRKIYMATQIKADDKSIKVNTPTGKKQQRLSGKIVNTASKTLEGRMSQPHLIALVKTDSGQKVSVDFGREKDLENVDVETGKEVVLLAEPVRIGSKKILVAHSVSIDGEQIDVEWVKGLRQQQQKRQQQISMSD